MINQAWASFSSVNGFGLLKKDSTPSYPYNINVKLLQSQFINKVNRFFFFKI